MAETDRARRGRRKGTVPGRASGPAGKAAPRRRTAPAKGRDASGRRSRWNRPPAAAPAKPLTRAERRARARVRRGRTMLAASAVLSALVVAAWFPAADLYHQHQQLTSSTSQLDQVRREDHALQQEHQRLGSSAEVARIAQDQYQLAPAGQQVYEVLPLSGTNGGGTYSGDPGSHGPVAPSGAVELPPGSEHPSSGGSSGGSGHAGTTGQTAGNADKGDASTVAGTHTSSSLLGRIGQTLEFWR